MQNLNETLKQLDQLQYNYGKVGNTMTKEEYKAEFKRIAESTKFVPDSEAKLDAPFWETGVNPVTMTKIHDTYDWVEDEKNTIDYNYEF